MVTLNVNGKETTEEANGDEETHKDADFPKNGEAEKAENGHENGDAEKDLKRKVDETEDAEAALEPIPVSAEKIAKLTETTEEKEEVKEVEATS